MLGTSTESRCVRVTLKRSLDMLPALYVPNVGLSAWRVRDA
jgi:hypothetical protein